DSNYYIWLNNTPVPASKAAYEIWEEAEAAKYALPPIQNNMFKCWAGYDGHVKNNAGNPIEPFMFYSESLGDDGDIICMPYATFEEAQNRYNEFKISNKL